MYDHSNITMIPTVHMYRRWVEFMKGSEELQRMQDVCYSGRRRCKCISWMVATILSWNLKRNNIGSLLHSKNMDAEAACTMWAEANAGRRSQHIILRHLVNFLVEGSLCQKAMCVSMKEDHCNLFRNLRKWMDKALLFGTETLSSNPSNENRNGLQRKRFLCAKWI